VLSSVSPGGRVDAAAPVVLEEPLGKAVVVVLVLAVAVAVVAAGLLGNPESPEVDPLVVGHLHDLDVHQVGRQTEEVLRILP
jgi:hypothetical protein